MSNYILVRSLGQLMVLGIIGFFGVAVATTWGVALSNDSVNYLSAARAPLEGREFTITQYQPLYPAVLAAGTWWGADVLTEARWLGALLFCLNIVLMGVFISRYSGARWPALLGGALFLTSVPLLRVHSYALSEPLFLFLTIACLLALCVYLDTHRFAHLLIAGVLAGCALLTRYLGLPLIAVGVLGLWLFDRPRAPARLVAFAALSIAPSIVWLIRNFAVTGGDLTDRTLSFHPLTAAHLQGASTLLGWFVPSTLAKPLASALPPPVVGVLSGGAGRILFVVVAVLGALVLILLARAAWRGARSIDWRRLPYPLALPALLLVLYPLAVLLSLLLFDTNTQPDSRILAPVQLSAILLVCLALPRAWPALDSRARFGLAAVCAGFVVMHAAGAVVLVLTSAADGQGYASRQWQQSATIDRLRAWPARVTVYASQSEAVLALTDRPAQDVPWKVQPISLAPNADYPQQMQAMVDEVRRGDAIIVYLYQAATAEAPYRSYLPTDAELSQSFGLQREDLADGAIYTPPAG